jgi:hypothetical protein
LLFIFKHLFLIPRKVLLIRSLPREATTMSDSPKEPPDITYENDKPDDERPLFRDPLSRAHDMGLAHIKTKAISISDPPERRAVFKVTVTMRIEDELLDFVGHGDCDDKNTHALIAPHYIRMAETRAIARALRWATNEGRTCAEEMPSYDGVIFSLIKRCVRTTQPAKIAKAC